MMTFVLVPAGEFTMGSDTGGKDEKPFHKVSIAKPFYLGKYEVTQKQWEAMMPENRSRFRGNDFPVDRVSFNDCKKFTDALMERWPGSKFRLPTEAEWEYACRAGSTGDYCCANNEIGQYAWYEKNCDNTTHPVGQKKPNAWNLHDMHGNVFEWCADYYEPSYDGAPVNGSARPKDKETNRVLRGGAYDSPVNKLRSAYRCWGYPPLRDRTIGLRVVLEAP
jgi:formylglycine-generating enzyme required for sulfatase activity